MIKKLFYDPPLVSVSTLRVEASFCESSPVESKFGTGTMTEKDYTGLWTDLD